MANLLKNALEVKPPSGQAFKFGIIYSEWHSLITKKLTDVAISTLIKHGALEQNIKKISVPGSYELCSGADLLLKKNPEISAVICLGCVIQGETKHFDFICQAVSNGLMQVSIEHEKPVIFGVLTTNTQKEAEDRCGGKFGNKGEEAAIVALKMATEFN